MFIITHRSESIQSWKVYIIFFTAVKLVLNILINVIEKQNNFRGDSFDFDSVTTIFFISNNEKKY